MLTPCLLGGGGGGEGGYKRNSRSGCRPKNNNNKNTPQDHTKVRMAVAVDVVQNVGHVIGRLRVPSPTVAEGDCSSELPFCADSCFGTRSTPRVHPFHPALPHL